MLMVITVIIIMNINLISKTAEFDLYHIKLLIFTNYSSFFIKKKITVTTT
jgi:hypothetical protein